MCVSVRIKPWRGWSLPESRATPEGIFTRRRLLLAAGAGTIATAAGIAGTAAWRSRTAAPLAEGDPTAALYPAARNDRFGTPGPLSVERHVTSYNNFYEFGHDKRIWRAAQRLPIRPWTVKVGGLVEQPFEIGLDDLLARLPLEERIYRHRCVEGWSMIVPWSGFALASLVGFCKPLGSARYLVMRS